MSNRLTKEEIEYVRKNHGYTTVKELAKQMGRIPGTIQSLITRREIPKVAEREFAIYKGDRLTFTGSRKECVEFMGIKPTSFSFMMSPTYEKRTKGTNVTRIVDMGIWEIEGETE